MIVAFTGHRPSRLGGYGPSAVQDWVREQIRHDLKALKPVGAISGMALGVDTWAAEECLALGIPFVVAIPFAGQEWNWPQVSQERYKYLLSKALRVCVVSPGGYEAFKMQVRNEWMVNHCNTLIAVWDGTPGGTSNCVHYAKERAVPIRRIDPRNMPI